MDGEQEHDPATVEASWEVRQDEVSGQVYYWNTITGETSWESSSQFAPAEELSNTEDVVHPWTQAFDDSGRVYYLNTETMETRWTPLPTAGEQQEDASMTSDVLAITGGRGRRPSTADQMNELNRLLSGEGEEGEEEEEEEEESPAGEDAVADHQKASQVTSPASHESTSPVAEKSAVDTEACPWMMFLNEDDGLPYYYNHTTGECLWDPPEEFLRFHQEQQLQEQQEPDEAIVDATEPALAASLDNAGAQDGSKDVNNNADSMTAGVLPDGAAMQIAITPEFEEKVRQAIATVSNTPVGSSRLVLVRTPTQEQLVPRTGRSAGDGISARSGSSSARPRSGFSRPSSGGALSRPRTPSGGVISSRLEPILPTAEYSSALEEEISVSAVRNEQQGEVAGPPVDELPVPNEQDEEGRSPLSIQADSAEESEAVEDGGGADNEEEVNIDMAVTSGAEAETDTVEGETESLATAEVPLYHEAVKHLEEPNNAGAGFQALSDATDEVNAEVDTIGDAEAATIENADDFPNVASLQQSVQVAALTLQCMTRCFVARQRVKLKREERQNASPPATIEVPTEIDVIATAAAVVIPVVESEDADALPSLPLQEGPQEEEPYSKDIVPTPSEDMYSNDDSSAVDQQPPRVSVRSDVYKISGSVETLPSARPVEPPVQSHRKVSADVPTQEQRRRSDPAPNSTRLPSVLDVTKYFPQRRTSTSSRLAKGSTPYTTEVIAITRKKVDIGSPPRARRAFQQEAERMQAEHEQLLETRKREEERIQRAQVIEYQRIFTESRKKFEVETQRLLDEKLVRDNQREHNAAVEKRTRIQAQRERDAARARNRTAGDEADRLLWEHLKTQGRPTEQSVSRFRDALSQALDPAQFTDKMCAERARELHERINRLHRASWTVDSQLESVELRLLSELHPLTVHQRPLQAKYAAKLRCRLEQMLNTVQYWQRVLDEWEVGKEEGATSRYWGSIHALSSATFTSDDSRRQYVLNTWRGAAGGDSLLHVAVWNGWEEHVRLLIEEGADVNSVDSSASHRTPLHEACRAGHAPVVEMLLRSGARLNDVDVSGDSPLHVACRGGWTRVVRILLMAANDLREETEHSTLDEKTPLSLEGFFNLRNGKGRRAIEVATLPSLIEELENYDYQPKPAYQQGQLNNGVKPRQVKNKR